MRPMSKHKTKNSSTARLLTASSAILEPMEKRMMMSSTLTAWTFSNYSVSTTPNITPAPSAGSGSAISVGFQTGTTSTKNTVNPYPYPNSAASGATSGDISDMVAAANMDVPETGTVAWRVRGNSDGWSSNAALGTQGVQFKVSTAGYSGISLQFDFDPSSASAASALQVQYTTDGTSWNNASSLSIGTASNGSTAGITVATNSSVPTVVNGSYFQVANNPTGLLWENNLTADFSGIPSVNNNANFGVRIVNAATGASDFEVTGTGSTPIAMPAAGAGNWRFDNVRINGTVLVVAPAITQNPTNQSTSVGNPVTFTSAASNYTSVQWQVSNDGGTTFAPISGATSPSYTFTPSAVTGSMLPRYEASYTNSAGTTNTSSATLTVVSAQPPTITLNPAASQTVTVGSAVTYTAAATATPSATVQWYVEPVGSTTFTAISGATSTTYSFTAAASNNGSRYEASFTNIGGTTNTSAGTLTVNFAPSITAQPTSQYIQAGATATFTATASANPAVSSIQWQLSTDGVNFNNIAGATSGNYSVVASTATANTLYRAVFTNSVGSTNTNAAALTVIGEPVAQWIFNHNYAEVNPTGTPEGEAGQSDATLTTGTAVGTADAPLPTFSGSSTDIAQSLGLFNPYQGTYVNSATDIFNTNAPSGINPNFAPYAWRIRSGHTITGWSQLAPELTTGPDGSGGTLDPQGVLFKVNTSGYSNLTFHFQWKGGGIADMQPQYSPDGGQTWKNAGAILQNFSNDYPGITATTTPPGYYVSFEGAQYGDANNNPNFQIRLVSAYDPNLPLITDGNTFEPATVHGQYADASAGAQNAQQVLDLGGSPTYGANQYRLAGGNYQLSFGGYTTGLIAYNAAPLDVQNALAALPSIGTGNVAVVQTLITPFTTASASNALLTIKFQGTLGHAIQPTITVVNNTLVDSSNNPQTATLTTWVPGAAGASLDANGNQLGVTRYQDGGSGWELSNFSLNGLVASGAPSIVTQPANATVVGGTTAAFTATDYSETSPVTAQWQINTGSGFTNITGATSYDAATNTSGYTYTSHVNLSDNGYQFRVIFTNANGSTTSMPATLTVVTPVAPSVTTQPIPAAAQVGYISTFTATATGSPSPTVQWQFNTGSGWNNLTDNGISVFGSTTTTLSLMATQAQVGVNYQVRAVFSNVVSSVSSNAVAFTSLGQETVITDWNFNGQTVANTNNPAPIIGTGTASGLGMMIPYNPNDGASGTDGLGTTNIDDITATQVGLKNPAFTEQLWRVRGGSTAGVAGSPYNGWSNFAKEYTQGAGFASSTVGYSGVYVTMDWYSTKSGEENARQQYTLDGTNWYNLDDGQLAYNGSTNPSTGLDNLDPGDPNAPLNAGIDDYYGATSTFNTTSITAVSLTSNVATLTDNNTYAVGQTVNVAQLTGANARFNGIYTITAATSSSFSYALSGTDVATTAATGSASLGGYITPLMFNLTGISGASNNANFAVRLVNAYNPSLSLITSTLIGDSQPTTHGQYAISSSGNTPTPYPGSAGNWRFDNIVFHGLTATPAWLASNSQATYNANTKVLTVTGPSTIIGDPGTDAPIIVANGSAAQLSIDPSSVKSVNIGGLTLSGGAGITLTSTTQSDILIVAAGGNISIDSSSKLDLGRGYADFQATSASQGNATLTTVNGFITSGYANGAWTGTGITSSSAATNVSHLTALGLMLNNSVYGAAGAGLGTFDGFAPAANDVLVRYTYYGDANLNGKVDGSDYSVVDSAFSNNGPATWAAGNFNYDSSLDGSDYTLLDNAFNSQGAQIQANIATPFSQNRNVQPAAAFVAVNNPISPVSSSGFSTIKDLLKQDQSNTIVGAILDGPDDLTR